MFFNENSISAVIKHIRKELSGLYNDEEIRNFALMLIEEYAAISRTQILSFPYRTMSESELLKIHFAVKQLKKYCPIQYVFGKASFCNLDIKVTSDVLIPRPETEELVEWIINDCRRNDASKKNVILDIGTGSGCIALAVAAQLEQAEVIGADISENALSIARENAALLGLQVLFYKMDILNDNDWQQRPFDIIVCNPPYVRISEKKVMNPNVTLYEPELALYVNDDDPLIYYRAVLRFANLVLNSGGALYFEINEAFGLQIKALAQDNHFADVTLRKDLSGKHRMLRCIQK